MLWQTQQVAPGCWAVLCKASEVPAEYLPQQLAVLQGPRQQQSCYQEVSDLLKVETRVCFAGWGCGAHCNHTSRVLPEALPLQTLTLQQTWDTMWLLSKVWDRKIWRGCIIIFLTVAGAKNLVTIFALEPNCSQTSSCVYSVDENYPAFLLCNNHRVRIPRQGIFLYLFYSLLKHASRQVTGKPQIVWLHIWKVPECFLPQSVPWMHSTCLSSW